MGGGRGEDQAAHCVPVFSPFAAGETEAAGLKLTWLPGLSLIYLWAFAPAVPSFWITLPFPLLKLPRLWTSAEMSPPLGSPPWFCVPFGFQPSGTGHHCALKGWLWDEGSVT